MQIKIIINDISYNGNLGAEHGFSAYIENSQKILFDTGKSSLLFDNAKKMNINPIENDYIILSHNHYDHTGGLEKFMISPVDKTDLIIGSSFFTKKYKFAEKKYSLISSGFIEEKLLVEYFNLLYVENILQITEELFVLSLNGGSSILKDYFYVKDTNGNFISDNFDDEIILIIKKNNGLTIISGCSHTGIPHIINKVNEYFPNGKIRNIIGGLHLEKVEDDIFEQSFDLIKSNDIKVFCGHCTGNSRMQEMRRRMGEQIEFLFAGKIIVI